MKGKFQTLIQRNCLWILYHIFQIDYDEKLDHKRILLYFDDISTSEKKNIKKVIFQELNLIMTTEKTCQIQLTKLERWVKLIGTELFTRFLVSFIYQQTRR